MDANNLEIQIARIRNSGLFDADYYYKHYRDVAAAGLDPVVHYCRHGWKERRNPSDHFDTGYYLKRNPDILAAGMNPLYHYLCYGKNEGRSPKEGNLYISSYQIMKDEHHRMPLVTVLVPNFNHAGFLRERLNSIYNQTYPNYEVILMDDCSRDNSREILREYLRRYPAKTRLVLNDRKSGGVFHQWEKGVSMARGELIWIAESDDWCTPNFLEELTKYFRDEAVMLAYCQTYFINDTGRQIWSLQQFLQDLNKDWWNQPFIMPAHKLVQHAWSIKNIVPNVSSALFKNPVRMGLIKNQAWKSMHICGDWMFYLAIIQGGLAAYTTKANNYYRIHSHNTSVGTYIKDIYYREHEEVSKFVQRHYVVPAEVFKRNAENLKQHWTKTRGAFSEKEFVKLYNIPRILAAAKDRKPHIMMAGYSFTPGGGETLPIFMANGLKNKGYSVTFLCLDKEQRVPGIQNMLRKDIPIVNHVSNLNRIMIDFNIHIIQSHHAWADKIIMEALPPALPYAHVASLHGMYELLPPEILQNMLPSLIARTSKLVYTAEKNLNPFKHAGLFKPDHFVKIGNFYQGMSIQPVDLRRIGIPAGAFVLCLVSRAIAQKGWEEAIEIVKAARNLSGRNIHLLLIGSGPEVQRLKDRAPGFIHFLGFQDRIQNYFAAADLGFLPSRYAAESFPLVVIACLLSGKPVLATNLGEIERMLRDSWHLAGSVFDLEQGRVPIGKVAEIVAQYAADPGFYQGKIKHVQAAAAKFRMDRVLLQYEKLYLELYRKHR